MDIVLSASDLIEDIRERAKENKRKAMSEAHKSNSNHKKDSLAPTDAQLSKPLTPTKQNREIAKLTGVSERTVDRAKRVKKEAPENCPFYWTLTL